MKKFPILAAQVIGLPGRAPAMIAKIGLSGYTATRRLTLQEIPDVLSFFQAYPNRTGTLFTQIFSPIRLPGTTTIPLSIQCSPRLKALECRIFRKISQRNNSGSSVRVQRFLTLRLREPK